MRKTFRSTILVFKLKEDVADKENTFSFLISSSKHKRETKKGTGKLTKNQKSAEMRSYSIFTKQGTLQTAHVRDDHKMHFFLN